jgi:TolB-like protein
LLNVLAKVNGLKVASRSSAFAFKGQDTLVIPHIAGKLKVPNMLTTFPTKYKYGWHKANLTLLCS